MAASGRGSVDEVAAGLKRLEKRTAARSVAAKPLLVSVRSRAVSSAGMMDTILNLGISDESVKAVAAESGNGGRLDCYRRFVQNAAARWSRVCRSRLEDALSAMKQSKGVSQDADLTADDLERLVEQLKQISNDRLGGDWTSDPREQLDRAINAVLGELGATRAPRSTARQTTSRPRSAPPSTSCRMVFGNMEHLATGVCFTRNPLPRARSTSTASSS